MPFESGVRLGPYEILSPIDVESGEEVYKASDTEQNRTVAIKVLPPHFSESPELKQRLEREVQLLSGLNHPHIRAAHEIRREGDVDLLVTEHLEGETLTKRLEGGAMPLDEALKLAIDVADALNLAHRAGLVHRNLRPSNIMLTPNGAKLLDFGLANLEPPKAQSAVPASEVRSKVTLPDVPDEIVRYMSPEQIEGREADARSDVFAFGAILYEMVTGEKAFEGRNRPMLIAAIASLDPYPMSKNQPDSPPMLDHVAQRCLAKDPDDRWQTVHDLMVQLRWVAEGGDVLLAAARARQKRERRVLAVVAAALFFGTILVTEAIVYWRGADAGEPFQFRVPVAGLNTSDISISPDGTYLAFAAKPNNQESTSLYVRRAGFPEFRRLVGTEDAAQPFWSPDSRSIAFTVGGRLKRVDATGGAPKDLGEAPGFTGGAWGKAGIIVFGSAKGLYRVSEEGGKPEAITAIEKQETGHFWPSFLPDGQRFLYSVWSDDAANRAVFAGKLGSKDKTKVMAAETNVEYADPGYILFHREATLYAQPFDANTLTTKGDALHIADQVTFSPTNGRGSFDASQNGSVLYFQGEGGRGSPTGRGGAVPNYQWAMIDRKGTQLELAGETGNYGDMDLSPDGRFIAVTQPDAGASGADIYVIDWQRAGVSDRLTLDPGDDINPVWAWPDGDRIAFTTYRKGNADIYIKNANRTGAETPLLDSPNDEIIEAWSPDGRYIAYKQGPENAEDIWILPLFGDKKPFPIVQGPFRKDEPQFSYDGKWLAYASNELGGIFQVYVVSLMGGERFPISKDGGGQPRWRKDGRELFFRSPVDGSAMGVEITPGPKLSVGIPYRLFGSGAMSTQISMDPARHQWAVTPDGQRFLARVPPNQRQAGGGGFNVPPVNFTAALRPGQASAAGSQQGFVSTGLTVIRRWPALHQKEAP